MFTTELRKTIQKERLCGALAVLFSPMVGHDLYDINS